MQKYPSIKNDKFGWRRLEGDYIPQKQIWMVFDEESDLFAKNSGLKNSEVAQGVHNVESSVSGQENKNLNLSIDKNNFFSDKVNKEFDTLRSIYDFHSEDSESGENEYRIKGQQKTYSRKPRYSQLVKRNSIWNSSSDKYEKENKSASGQSNSKLKSREKLKVIYTKPKNYMHDITNKTLKDEKNRRNSHKRKLFNPSGDLKNNEEHNQRSSSRRRKIVNYFENQVECSSESSSDYESENEDETENEDENGNKIKKRVECPTIVKTSHLSAYEQMVERNKEANRRMLEEMGILKVKTELEKPKTREKETKDLRGRGRPKGLKNGKRKPRKPETRATHGMKTRGKLSSREVADANTT